MVPTRFEACDRKLLQELSVWGTWPKEICSRVLVLHTFRVIDVNKSKSVLSHSQDEIEFHIATLKRLMCEELQRKIMEQCVIRHLSSSRSCSNFEEFSSLVTRALKAIHFSKTPSKKETRLKTEMELSTATSAWEFFSNRSCISIEQSELI